MTLRQVLYRVGSGVANVLPRNTPGIVTAVVARLWVTGAAVAAAVAEAAKTVVTAAATGVQAVSWSTVLSRPTNTPGVATGATLTGGIASQTPAAQVVHIKYDLTRRNGAAAATSVGANAWPNPANATGYRDGTTANARGQLAAQSYSLRLTYPASTGKTGLTITGCELRFFLQFDALLGNATLATRVTGTGINYSSGTGWVAAGNYLTTPVVLNLFDKGATTWAAVDSLQVFLDATTTAASTGGVNVDAVELVVTATATTTS